jgi:hypothetical protein
MPRYEAPSPPVAASRNTSGTGMAGRAPRVRGQAQRGSPPSRRGGATARPHTPLDAVAR